VEAKAGLLYLKSSGVAGGSLSFNVIRLICSYFEDARFFAALYLDGMELYDFKTHQTTRHPIPQRCTVGIYRETELLC